MRMNNMIINFKHITTTLDQFIDNTSEISQAFLTFSENALNLCETIGSLDFLSIIGNLLIIGVILLCDTAKDKDKQSLKRKRDVIEDEDDSHKQIMDLLTAKVPINSKVCRWNSNLNAYAETRTRVPGIFLFNFLKLDGSGIRYMPADYRNTAIANVDGSLYVGFYYQTNRNNTSIDMDRDWNDISTSTRW